MSFRNGGKWWILRTIGNYGNYGKLWQSIHDFPRKNINIISNDFGKIMSKNEADNTKRISTTFLRQNGYFQGWKSGIITWTKGGMLGDEYKSSVGVEVSTLEGDNYLRIHYTQTDQDTDEKKDFDYKIPLTTTSCRYGGKRYWFICPWYKNNVYCGKRVGTLYKDGDYFACRHCYNLTYSSQKTNRRHKMFSLFNVLTLEQKIEKLQEQVKHPYYKNKSTRKQKQLEKLYKQAGKSYEHYTQLEQKNMV